MTITERKRKLKSKFRCAVACTGLIMMAVVPIGTRMTIDVAEQKEDKRVEAIALPIKTREVQKPIIAAPAKAESELFCRWLDMEISQKDFELLCWTTFCEAGTQDMDTQAMVCLTILNRYANGFGDSIREVVYARNAYEVTVLDQFKNVIWNATTEVAVKMALKENNHPKDMYYFRIDRYHGFGQPYVKSDDVYFSTEGVGK